MLRFLGVGSAMARLTDLSMMDVCRCKTQAKSDRRSEAYSCLSSPLSMEGVVSSVVNLVSSQRFRVIMHKVRQIPTTEYRR